MPVRQSRNWRCRWVSEERPLFSRMLARKEGDAIIRKG